MQVVAPAGSFSALRAAVNAGADAVYLGLPQFGARAKAENFTEQNFASAVEYAHIFGTKVFVTLNTLIKDGEMNAAVDLARFAYEHGADAAIVQDLRFIKELKRRVPMLDLHASTQMGIHNAYGAMSLLDLGIKRAVLARETLPCDIEKIKSTGIEIEFFVQGALCVSFSGNCYFSSLASSYSGNRGKCMQLCRKPYYFHGKRGYFLSAKDLCLYDDLDTLQKLGVDAIKIEGRMRSDEYVFRAVSTYKSHLPSDKAKNALKAVFNRGDYCNAYLNDGAQFRAVYPEFQANIGKYIGKISVDGKKVKINGYKAHSGDGYKIMRGGKEIGGARAIGNDIIADCACKNGDVLRLTFDGKATEELENTHRKIALETDVDIIENNAAAVTVHAENSSVSVFGDIVQPAKTSGLRESDVVRAFEKVSDYPFKPSVRANIGENVFMPISALNDLRRNAYKQIYEKILSSRTDSSRESKLDYHGLNYTRFNGSGNILMVESLDDLTDEILSKVDYIALNPRDYNAIPQSTHISKPILLNLPVVMRGDDVNVIRRAVDSKIVYGVISNNMYSLKLTDKPILLGTGHNIIGECEYPHIISFEADKLSENGFLYAFGYAPLMTFCHCVYGKCVNCSGNDSITDESGRTFGLRRFNTAHCYWQYLNCVPHNLIENKIKNKFFDCSAIKTSDIPLVLNGDYRGGTRGNTNKGLK